MSRARLTAHLASVVHVAVRVMLGLVCTGGVFATQWPGRARAAPLEEVIPRVPRLRGVRPERAAHANPSDDVTVLPPAPAETSMTPAASLDSAPDLSPFLGLALVGVDVVLDDPRWPDVQKPSLASMRVGDHVSPSLVRRAIAEALATGQFADARVDTSGRGAGSGLSCI